MDVDNLAEVYRECFSLGKAAFYRIDHHDTMIAVVYRVNLPSEKPLILKISTRDKDFHRELYFLNALADFIPVPRVQKVAEPVAGRAGAVLMECLEGSLLRESNWTHELAYDVGSKLALLHSKRTEAYGDFTQKRGHTNNAREYFQEKFFEELEECGNHLPEETIKCCKDYCESHRNLFDSVDGPCMVHRDFRPGNMIVQNGRLMGIIDWASGRFGFAEQDFCSMEHRNWSRDSEYKQSLLAGYSSIRQVPNYTAIMPLLRLGRALAVIGFTVKSGTWKGKDQEIYQYNRRFLDNFLLEGNP
ncbi:MAG: aminoglycoside phosphotransferase family protein [Waddliaceae bacterium]